MPLSCVWDGESRPQNRDSRRAGREHVFHTELVELINELLASSCLQCAVVICEQWLTALPVVRLRTQDGDGRKRSSSLKVDRVVKVHVVPAKVLMAEGQPHMRPFDLLPAQPRKAPFGYSLAALHCSVDCWSDQLPLELG